jgi:hypothetical protein
MKKDFDPELSKRQTSANCAMAYCGNAGMTPDELKAMFPVIADIVLDYLNGGAPKSDAGVASEGGTEGAASGAGDDDIPF